MKNRLNYYFKINHKVHINVLLFIFFTIITNEALAQQRLVTTNHKGTQFSKTIVTTSTTVPSTPTPIKGDVWFDTTDTDSDPGTNNIHLKIFDGTNWVNAETLTVLSIATNDNATPADASDDFRELTYEDEDGVLNKINLGGINTPWYGTDDNGPASLNSEAMYVTSPWVGIGTSTAPTYGEQMTVDGHINITGTGNSVFIGGEAGKNDDLSDNKNVFVGNQTGYSNTIGDLNSFIGVQAGYSNTTGSYNLFNGYIAGYSNTAGNYNNFIGVQAGYLNTIGSQNNFIGYKAGYSNTSGNHNIFNGFYAGYSNTTGNDNIFNGYLAGYYNTTASDNIFNGQEAGFSNTIGTHNIFTGDRAGYNNTSGNDNTFNGYRAGYNNTTGINNFFTGKNAGFSNTMGNNNFFISLNAGYNNTTGSNNIFNGNQAGMNNTTGNNNIFNGYRAGFLNISGFDNIFNGANAGNKNTTGNNNVFNGVAAGYNNTIGEYNIFTGYQTGYDNTTGSNSVIIGHSTGLGITTGGNNTIIGANVTGLPAALDSNIIIADGNGNQRIRVLTNGFVGINNTAPTERLHVTGNILASGTITPDYVFEKYFNGKSILKEDYTMMSLDQIEAFAKKNMHLPGVPSALEVKEKGGIVINRATEINLEKIEELYLHLIELNKEAKALKAKVGQLEKALGVKTN